jgi:hypothetical protein
MIDLGMRSQALAEARALSQSLPDRPFNAGELLSFCLRLGDPNTGLAVTHHFMAIDPRSQEDRAQTCRMFASMFCRTGHFGAAASFMLAYPRYCAGHSEQAITGIWKAEALLAEGLRELRGSIGALPEGGRPEMWFFLSLLWESMGEIDNARAAVRVAADYGADQSLCDNRVAALA